MAYIGLQSQIWRNNNWSIFLLISFPSLVLLLTWSFFYFINYRVTSTDLSIVNDSFLNISPFILLGVFLWFLIAYSFHSSMINKSVGAKGLSRKSNSKVYNLLENLSISQGMTMPKLQIINDDSLNAFASGINKKTYTITLSRGIINKLNEKELEAVLAHELTHIKNKDTRLLIISIIFVGIFGFLAWTLFRSLGASRNKEGNKLIIVAVVLVVVGYIFSILFKFALSRKREYLADAGAVDMTKSPLALANALRKISGDSEIEALTRKDLAQAFIENPSSKLTTNLFGLFSTHPPIKNRIRILENF